MAFGDQFVPREVLDAEAARRRRAEAARSEALASGSSQEDADAVYRNTLARDIELPPRVLTPSGRTPEQVAADERADAEDRERTNREYRQATFGPRAAFLREHIEAAERAQDGARARARGALVPLLEGQEVSEQARAAALQRAAKAFAEAAGYDPTIALLRRELATLERRLEG